MFHADLWGKKISEMDNTAGLFAYSCTQMWLKSWNMVDFFAKRLPFNLKEKSYY